VLRDVGECRDYLLFWWKFGRFLELEIANGSRQSKVSVDATKVDKAASSRDARTLG